MKFGCRGKITDYTDYTDQATVARVGSRRAARGPSDWHSGIEGGTLALLADVGASIEACGLAGERPADRVASGRAVLSDDGAAITLTLYTQIGAIAAIALDPVRTVGLTARLIAAALPRLSAP